MEINKKYKLKINIIISFIQDGNTSWDKGFPLAKPSTVCSNEIIGDTLGEKISYIMHGI